MTLRLLGLGLLLLTFLSLTETAKASAKNGQNLKTWLRSMRPKRDGNSVDNDRVWTLADALPGTPDEDYPILAKVPNTGFSCEGRNYGYYADVEARCQAFRICANTAGSSKGFGFLCPNGTLFNQKFFVCDWYMNVDCSVAPTFYGLNDLIGDAMNAFSRDDIMATAKEMMQFPKQQQPGFGGNNNNGNNNGSPRPGVNDRLGGGGGGSGGGGGGDNNGARPGGRPSSSLSPSSQPGGGSGNNNRGGDPSRGSSNLGQPTGSNFPSTPGQGQGQGQGSGNRPKGSSQGPKGSSSVGPKGSSQGPNGSQGPKGSSQGPKGSSQGPKGSSQGPKGSTQGSLGPNAGSPFGDGSSPGGPQRGANGGTVYVNSLGQLSTDDNSGFDPQHSFILRPDKDSNFDPDARIPNDNNAPIRGSADLSEPVDPSAFGKGPSSQLNGNRKQIYTYPHDSQVPPGLNGNILQPPFSPEFTGQINMKLAAQSPKYPTPQVYGPAATQSFGGPQTGQFSPQPGKFGSPSGQQSPQPGKFASPSGQFSPNQQPGKFGSPSSQFSPQSGQQYPQQPGKFGSPSSQFSPQSGQQYPQQPGKFSPQSGQFSPQPGKFGSPSSQQSPQSGKFSPNQPGKFGSPSNKFGSPQSGQQQPGKFSPQSGQQYPQQPGKFSSPSSQFSPQPGKFSPQSGQQSTGQFGSPSGQQSPGQFGSPSGQFSPQNQIRTQQPQYQSQRPSTPFSQQQQPQLGQRQSFSPPSGAQSPNRQSSAGPQRPLPSSYQPSRPDQSSRTQGGPQKLYQSPNNQQSSNGNGYQQQQSNGQQTPVRLFQQPNGQTSQSSQQPQGFQQAKPFGPTSNQQSARREYDTSPNNGNYYQNAANQQNGGGSNSRFSPSSGQSNEDYLRVVLKDKNNVHDDNMQLVELIQRFFVPQHTNMRVVSAEVHPSREQESYSFTYDDNGAATNSRATYAGPHQHTNTCGHQGY